MNLTEKKALLKRFRSAAGDLSNVRQLSADSCQAHPEDPGVRNWCERIGIADSEKAVLAIVAEAEFWEEQFAMRTAELEAENKRLRDELAKVHHPRSVSPLAPPVDSLAREARLRATAELFRNVSGDMNRVRELADETVAANPNELEICDLARRFGAAPDKKAVVEIANSVKAHADMMESRTHHPVDSHLHPLHPADLSDPRHPHHPHASPAGTLEREARLKDAADKAATEVAKAAADEAAAIKRGQP